MEEQYQEMAAQLRKPQGENGLKTGEWMNTGNNQMIHDTLRVVDPSGTDQLLEIGMGSGSFVPEILEKSAAINYTGVDYSEVMVAEAERHNAGGIARGHARFLLADANALPFPDASFNKVFSVNTIYFWGNETRVLAELKRVLMPEGKLILALRPKHQTEKYPFTKYGFKLFSKEDVSTLLVENGFSVLNCIENQEPDFELNGEVMKMENLIVVAERSQS
jgi:ubiquinone/menaquinone biosynthesis C-methylase UbiE